MNPTRDSTLADPQQIIADLRRERDEGLAREAAIAEVLEVINASPGDLTPVFDAILEKAHSLCGIAQGSLELYDGERFCAVAVRGLSEAFADVLRQGSPASDNPATRPLIEGERFSYIPDMAAADYSVERTAAETEGIRTLLCVPLRRDGQLLGMIASARKDARPYSEKQIALLENFAAQAVIAIENARLITETREALAQQTATTEVLQVINASPGDLAPVFNEMLARAMVLCEAAAGVLWVAEGDRFCAVASLGLPKAFAEYLATPLEGGPETGIGRLRRGEKIAHIVDLAAAPGYEAGDPLHRAAVDLGGVRGLLAVPLQKDGLLLGAFGITRLEVRPFTEKHIALLQNFAAQAVIAMENARLITETREALERQTALGEVLQVMAQPTFDLKTVLHQLVETAARLCGGNTGSVAIRDGDAYRVAASYGLMPEWAEVVRTHAFSPGRDTITGRVLLARRTIQIADITADPDYRLPAAAEIGKLRTLLGVPLLREGEVIGVMQLSRTYVEPFDERQIALVRTFSDQAVIAIENARLITETREALEQQTATAEVLGVINSSPGDLAPVFDTVLEKAMRLCEADLSVFMTYDGDVYRASAMRGATEEYARFLTTSALRPSQTNIGGMLIRGEPFVELADLAAAEGYRAGDPAARAAVDLGGMRTVLAVPLRQDNRLLGIVIVYRREVRRFTDNQIALVQNFAAQAVIAMENARLLTETREALEQQTATAEVLGVINSSPGDLAPVFDAMLERAMRLCEAAFGVLWVYEGDRYRAAAVHGAPAAFVEFLRQPLQPHYHQGTGLERALRGQNLVINNDMSAEEAYQSDDPMRRAIVDLGGARSHVLVALRTDEALLGAITIYRQEVLPFTEKHIALLQNFAAQAVIAMENARLITETREALEQQTATAEVLQVINSSPGELAPVFDAILEKAHNLCGAAFGGLLAYDGEHLQAAAMHGLPEPFAEIVCKPFTMSPEAPLMRLIRGEQSLVHIPDLAEVLARFSDDRVIRAAVELGGIRTLLAVPLRKDNTALGVITAYRQEVRPFSDKQIALLQNFAAQAVIAMENARLITETREALDQQTATAEVLGVINSSPGDLAPVFDTMLEKATRLCEAAAGTFWIAEGQGYMAAAIRGMPEVFIDAARSYSPGPDTPVARVARGEQVVHLHDIAIGNLYGSGDALIRAGVDAGIRTLLSVPLQKEGIPLGVFSIYRREVRPFSDKQIALVQNFAAQAVIAMENARLVTETREALEQQTATAEVLGVINSSPGDLNPVFEVMVASAAHLCAADEAAVRSFDGELLHLVTTHGTDPSALVRLHGLGPTELIGLYEPFARGAAVVHYVDARDTDAYRTYLAGRQRIDARGIRSWLAVALRKEGTLLGIINVHRREVRPFNEKQIALLQSFAAQAVIAMENARLLDEIRQRQAELRVTFDNMADGVAMFDQTLHLAAWNRNFQELLDLPDKLLAERPAFDIYIRYLTERGEFGRSDPESEIARLRARLEEHYSFERIRPDGTVIEVRNNPMPDGGVVVIYSDITERKRSEEEIRAARDAAEAAYHDLQAAQANLVQAQKMAALGQLTAGIAHEIKNPLNFVNNFASLSTELLDELKEDVAPALVSLDGDKREGIDETIEMLTGNLEKIVEHGQRADNIVKSMLEHSRGVSGERREVDINGLVEEALNLAYHGARAHDQNFNITLERDYAGNLKPIELAPQEITRVFLNLFGNGFYAANKRAHANGDGSFRPVLTVATCEDDDNVEIRVRDNGIGIPTEIRDKLFQPFFTTKPTGEGTGLGLSISYDIVTQQHGGTITVESEPGSFTEFTVRLPRH